MAVAADTRSEVGGITLASAGLVLLNDPNLRHIPLVLTAKLALALSLD